MELTRKKKTVVQASAAAATGYMLWKMMQIAAPSENCNRKDSEKLDVEEKKTINTTSTATTVTSTVEGKKLGRVYLIAGGTRGDAQPLALLGKELKELGYDITLFCGPQGKGWCDSYGFTHGVFKSYKDAVVKDKDVLDSAESKNLQQFITAIIKVTAEFMGPDLDTLLDSFEKDEDVVGVIAASTHMGLVPPLYHAKKIFVANLLFTPFAPTKDFLPYMVDSRDPATWSAIDPQFGEGNPIPSSMYKALWDGLNEVLATSYLGVFNMCIDRIGVSDMFPEQDEARKQLLKDMWKNEYDTPNVCLWSPILVENGPSDYTDKNKKLQLGYIFPDDDDDSTMFQQDKLEAFLENGDPPVYLGWGSMCRKKNDELVRAAIGACKKVGKRGVILSGWAGLHIDLIGDVKGDNDLKDYAAANCIFLETVNHSYLFPRCCALVTHGGAGTAASMLKSGTPGIITAVWWDQNFMGDRLEVLGAGLRGPHFTDLTPDNLAQLIRKVLENKAMHAKSKMICSQLQQENGKKKAAAYIHNRIQSFKYQPTYQSTTTASNSPRFSKA